MLQPLHFLLAAAQLLLQLLTGDEIVGEELQILFPLFLQSAQLGLDAFAVMLLFLVLMAGFL